MLGYVDLSQAPVELIVAILAMEPSTLGKLALISHQVKNASLWLRLELACQRPFSLKEIQRYQEEYLPLVRCEFMERLGDYQGMILHMCSHEDESTRYKYDNASGFGALRGKDIGLVHDSPMLKLDTDIYGDYIFILHGDARPLGHDLVTHYHLLSERVCCPGFARRVVLDTLKHHQSTYSADWFYVYLRCNAMVMGIAVKNERARTVEELKGWYYPRVLRYLESLDGTQSTEGGFQRTVSSHCL